MARFVCPWKFRLVGLIGLVLSLYALYVEEQKKQNPDYEALCDFGAWNLSCSSVFASKYGHLLFGLPNALFGAAFYVAVLLYTVLTFIPGRHHLMLLFTGFSCVFSVYLMTCLISLGDLCIVCTATYVVNFILFYYSWKQVKASAAAAARTKKQD